MHNANNITAGDELIDIEAVTKVTSLSKPTIYRLMHIGRFPKAKPLTPGGRRVAWGQSEVKAWLTDPLGWCDEIAF